jgi:hypothetical protein
MPSTDYDISVVTIEDAACLTVDYMVDLTDGGWCYVLTGDYRGALWL